MSERIQMKGSCLCGAVVVNAATVRPNAGACHCNMCRKWGGGPLLVVECGTDVSFRGEENKSVYDSSEWAERGFCSKCGTHLFYKLKKTGQYMIPVGLFDGDEQQIVFDHQIFIEEKPAYYCFSNKTENMTGAEVFAKFENL